MYLLTFIKLFHLVGLIMGLGGAVLLDMTVLTRGVIRPVSQFTIHQAHVLSRIVSLGLAILWVTGAALIWVNLADKPEYVSNPKLWAKIAIVAVLTLNGVLIHHKVLPLLKQKFGKRLFEGASRWQLLALTMIGSISVTSWMAPFILGKASELNYVTPLLTILSMYAASIAVMWVILFLAMSSISQIQSVLAKVAAMAYQNSEDWENLGMNQAPKVVPIATRASVERRNIAA